MEIIFLKVALNQIKKLKPKVTHDDVAAMIDNLMKDENFQATLRQATAEGDESDEFALSFYDIEFDVTVTAEFFPAQRSVTITKVKRGNHMDI